MWWVAGKARIGLAGAAAAVLMIGYGAMQPTTAAAQGCHERYQAAPIDEAGTECPGNPTVWKSHTYAESGVGYYTETEDLGKGQSRVRVSYQYGDGRLAVAVLTCEDDRCTRDLSNGVPFPFEAGQPRQDQPRQEQPRRNLPGTNNPRPTQVRPSDMI
ncbi:MAG: hypothetical protein U0893_26640 [Chloroflexota bacterium]